MKSFHMMTGASSGIFSILRPSVSIYPALIVGDSASRTLAMIMFTTFVRSRTFSNLL